MKTIIIFLILLKYLKLKYNYRLNKKYIYIVSNKLNKVSFYD